MNIGVFKSLDCTGCLDSTLSRGDRGVSKFCSHNSLMVPDAKGKKQTYSSAKNVYLEQIYQMSEGVPEHTYSNIISY